ncbi:MAG: hypothetical protein IKF90_06655 [Parasporobacterium sp.]|nr:hypothetical protein [Parasporobacterium sp.]
MNGITLIERIDYTLSYRNNVDVSENAVVTATGIGNFTGSVSANFTIYPHDHVWTDPEYSWNTDLSAVTATHTCQLENCNVKTETETVPTVSKVTKAATCTTKGQTTYTATFENTAFVNQTKTVSNIPATGHNYKDVLVPATMKSGTKPTYAKTSVTPSKGSSYITVSKTGKVTVKKGIPKGSYTVKVKVTAKATTNYKTKTETKNLKIVVK